MSLASIREEERTAYSRNESRAIRRRSLALLRSVVRPMRGTMWLTVVLAVIASAGQTAGPAILAIGIDAGIPALMRGNAWPTAWIAGIYVASGIVAGLLIAWYIRLSARLSQSILMELRTRLFRHAQRLSLEFHESYTSGRVIARQTSDMDAVRELLDAGLPQFIQGLMYMVFTATMLLALDPPSGLVLMAAIVPVWFLTRWFQVRSQHNFRASRVASVRVIVQFVETMTGIRAVQAFRQERRNEQRFAEVVEEYRGFTARTLQLFSVFVPGLTIVGAFTLVGMILLDGFRVSAGELDVGIMLAAALYARRFFDPVEGLAQFYNGYQSAESALEKISGVLAVQPSVPDPVAPVPMSRPRGAVLFDDVAFHYRPDVPVLPAFTLDIPVGQTIALVGSTGAGKTTLAKLLARFYDPSVGRVMLDGVALPDLDPADLRRAVVMVTQESYVFSGTVGDNIALGKPDATRGEIVAAARAVGADAFIRELPGGYDADVNKRGGRLSAGQRQLVSFARAFLADPAVLILDEATSSLDIPSERQVQRGLTSLLADRTAIIIAHRLSTVAIADRVLVMEQGRIIEDGTPDALIGGTGKFAALHAAWRDSLA